MTRQQSERGWDFRKIKLAGLHVLRIVIKKDFQIVVGIFKNIFPYYI